MHPADALSAVLATAGGFVGMGILSPPSKVILIILLGFELHPMLVLMYLRQRQETTTTCRMQPPSQWGVGSGEWGYELLPWPLKLSYNCLPRPHTFHYIPIRSFVYTSYYANAKKTTAKCTRRLCRWASGTWLCCAPVVGLWFGSDLDRLPLWVPEYLMANWRSFASQCVNVVSRLCDRSQEEGCIAHNSYFHGKISG